MEQPKEEPTPKEEEASVPRGATGRPIRIRRPPLWYPQVAQGHTAHNLLEGEGLGSNTGRRTIRCDVCGAELANRWNLHRHMGNTHDGGKKNHICPICEKAFPNKYNAQSTWTAAGKRTKREKNKPSAVHDSPHQHRYN